MAGPYTHTFDYAPGDLVDVPHLCIDGAKILYCAIGRNLEARYLIQWPYMSTPHDTLVNALDVVPAGEDADPRGAGERPRPRDI